MLRLRRAELAAGLAADTARLATVEARLRMIEQEGHMSTVDVILKRVEPLRVAALSGIAASYGPADISPVIGPLYGELMGRLGTAGVAPVAGSPVAWYEPDPTEAGEAVVVHAAMPVDSPGQPGQDFAVVDLPALPQAATIIHHGPMDDVMGSLHALAAWIELNGFRPVGYHREVYLDYNPQQPQDGVTELQIEVVKAADQRS
jgi:effector-binding domain-containing protein